MTLGNIADAYALTPAQLGMVFHTVAQPDTATYFEQIVCRVDGAIDRSGFEQAWSVVAGRHEALRTSIHWNLDRPLQVVRRRLETPVEWLDWTQSPANRLEEWLEQDRRRGFDLERAPLWRVAMIAIDPLSYELVLSFHHAILDGWSLSIVVAEVLSAYAAIVNGLLPDLPPAPSFREFIAWLAGRDRAGAEMYWRRAFQQFAGSRLPILRASRWVSANAPGRLERAAPAEVAASLGAMARGAGVTPATVLQAAWALLLSRYNGEDRVVFGAMVAGRPPEIDGIASLVGMCVNTLPVPVVVPRDGLVKEWLREFQLHLGELREHEHTPLQTIQGSHGRPTPLFDTLFLVENYPVRAAFGGPAAGLRFDNVRSFEKTNYPLTVSILPGPPLVVEALWDQAVCSGTSVERLIDRYVGVLDQLTGGRVGRLRDVSLLRDSAVGAVERVVTETPANVGERRERLVHRAVARSAAEHPNAPAVAIGGHVTNYEALLARSGRVATALKRRGVAPEEFVGLVADRSADAVAALLGIMEAGAAFWPIPRGAASEPLPPWCRWVIVCGEPLAHDERFLHVGDLVRESTGIDAPDHVDLNCVACALPADRDAPPLSIAHQALTASLELMARRISLRAGRTFVVAAPPDSRRAVVGVLLSLVSGACAVLDPPDGEATESAFDSSVLEATALQLETVEAWPRDNVVARVGAGAGTRLTAGAIPGAVCYAPAPLIAGWVGDAACGDAGAPIFQATDSIIIRVLDDADLTPVTSDLTGQLYVGGLLARDYIGDPVRTAEDFVPDALGPPGSRLYRTGDLGRVLEDGRIEYLGPMNGRLRFNGRTINAGDVEQTLRVSGGVRQAVVACACDAAGQPRLDAWVVADVREIDRVAQALRRALDDLPVSTDWGFVDAIPLTANGELDIGALPTIGVGRRSEAHGFVAPHTATELALAQIWAEVLSIREVGLHDDFFDLGGDSIASIQIVVQARKAGLLLTVQEVLEQPTVARQARCCESQRPSVMGDPANEHAAQQAGDTPERCSTPAEPDATGEAHEYPLTPMQAGMLFHSLMAPGAGMYVQQMGCAIDGDFDSRAFEAAWRLAIDRHAILRTSFQLEDGDEPVQRVHSALDVSLPMQRIDWRHFDPTERQANLSALLAEQRRAGFQPDAPPLFSITVIRTAPARHELIVAFHHALLDGWSTSVLLDELFASYGAFRSGAEPALPSPPDLRRYFAWVAACDRSREKEFWRRELRGFRAPIRLPAPPIAAPSTTSEQGSQQIPGRLSTPLDPVCTAQLGALGRRTRNTLSTVLYAAWGLLLARYAGESDIAFGITVAGRPPEVSGIDQMVGLFINTVPLRMRVDPALSVSTWLAEIGSTIRALRPFEQSALNQIQRWSEIPAGTPLFTSIVVVENYPISKALQRSGSILELGPPWVEGKVNYPIAIVIAPGPVLRVEILYDRALITADHAQRLLTQFTSVLSGIVQAADRTVREIGLLPADQLDTVVHQWNHTVHAWRDADMNLGQAFAKQVQRTPDHVALVQGASSVRYRDLAQRAAALADRLRVNGVMREERVGVYLERSIDLVTALVGIACTGAAYVPLDPDGPPERCRYILRDAGARIVVTTQRLSANVFENAQPLFIEEIGNAVAEAAPIDDRPMPPSALAYVLYTSGSTGRPKGVAVSHEAAMNHMLWFSAQWPMEDERVLLKTPVTFDASGWEVWAPLLAGGTVVIAPPDAHRHPEEIVASIHAHSVTVLQVVPPLLEALVASGGLASCVTLKRIFSGGEALPAVLWKRFTEQCNAELVNLYGPTETTIDATYYVCTGEPSDEVPIGHPITNARAYVLDENMLPLPVGARGELYIGGAGVGRGYIGRPTLTAERFVPDPFGPPGARLYRTGDLVRWNANGTLHYLSRLDDQVKVRGHRVEPAEVEAAIRRLPGIREAAVVAQVHEGESHQLVAYVVAAPATPPPTDLRSNLERTLPDAMIPSYWVWLDALPLSPNGKVDRRALPPVQPVPARTASHDEPRSEAERLLREVFCEVLGLASCGTADSFFELGGDSILSLKVVARARRKGLAIQHRDLFMHPTIAALAGSATVLAPAATPRGRPVPALPSRPLLAPPVVDAARIEEEFELTTLQQGMLFHSLYAESADMYMQEVRCTIDGPLLENWLAEAFRAVVHRHPILRTSFHLDVAPRPLQAVWADASPECAQVDVTDLPVAERTATVQAFLKQGRRRPFELTNPSLLRLGILRTDIERRVVVLWFHHALLDGWSLGLLVQEMFATYAALAQGTRLVSDRSPSMRAFVEATRQEAISTAASLAARLSSAPGAPYLPIAERGRCDDQQTGERRRGRVLPAEVSAAIETAARRRGATVASLVHAAWAILLSRYAGTDDVVFGTTVSVRLPDLESLGSGLGLFINTLPVRLGVRGDLSVGEWLDLVHGELVSLRQSEHASLAEVQRLVMGSGAGGSLFDTLLVIENLPRVDVRWDELGLRLSEIAVEGRTNYPLTMLVVPGPIMALEAHYLGVFDDHTIERLLDHFSRLLAGIATQSELSVDVLPMLDVRERATLLEAAGAAPPRCDSGDTLHSLVERQSAVSPHRIAVVSGTRALTFAALEAQAETVAADLRRIGVGAESLVGVKIERSPEMVIALLGVLKAGAAYVPIDADTSATRTRALVERVGAVAVITTADNRELFIERARSTRLSCGDGSRHWADATADGAAYVIFTSGSTGGPKGVANSHRGITNRLLWMQGALDFNERDCVLQKTPYTFDVSLWDIFMPLIAGGKLVLAPPAAHADPDTLVSLIEEHGVTVLHFVPSLLAEFLPRVPRSTCGTLRAIICSGEALSPALVERALEVLPGVSVYNLYGPTEAAVDVSAWRCRRGDAIVPIGHPIDGVQLHVLSPAGEPTPIGGVGEIHIGGVAVARGYVDSPQQTAAAFVPDPFGRSRGARLYRTGDYGRRLASGATEFIGRIDRQLKIRGVRIEPAEIEAALASHPAVRRCAVIARNVRARLHLVAYAERAPGHGAKLEADLRRHLEERLPLALVPSIFVFVDELPTTQSGKIDAARLPELVLSHAIGGADPTDSATEQRLAILWAQLLNVQKIGALDNFFDLGGDSLLATRLIARVAAEWMVRLPVRELFANATLREFARRIDSAAKVPPEAELMLEREEEGDAPLSYSQERLWILAQLHPDSTDYHVPIAARLRGALNPSIIERALSVVGDRHAILRTRFVQRNGKPFACTDARATLRCERDDLSTLPPGAREEELRRRAAVFVRRQFDLAAAPSWRVLLVRLADDEHALILTLHHIVCDYVSLAVMLREFVQAYEAVISGGAPDWPPLTAQYAQFAKWQRTRMQGDLLARLLSFWTRELAGPLPILSLPKPARARIGGARTWLREVSPNVSSALRRMAREHDCTPYMVWLAAWKVLLSRYTGQTDLIVGTPTGNRPLQAFEQLIGPFVNTLAIRTDLSGNPSFGEVLRRVRAKTLAAWDHQELPFELLVTELKLERDLHRTPVFQVFFDLLGAEQLPAFTGLQLSPLDVEYGAPRFELSLFVKDRGATFSLFLEHSEADIEPGFGDQLADSLVHLVRAAIDDPTRSISKLPLVDSATSDQFIHAGRTLVVPDVPIHQRIAGQALRTPEGVAVSQRDTAPLAYKELLTRARRISAHLLVSGVRPEQPVGVLMERTPDLVASMLGVLGAGGAYVPIDPHLPPRRWLHILEQADIRLLLSDVPRRGDDLGRPVSVIDVNRFASDGDEAPEHVDVVPGQLAYILYTSGSTGVPKGAMVEHAALLNHLFSRKIPELGIGTDDVVAQIASQSFDISVWQLLTALAVGGRVHIIGDRLVRDPFLLLQELDEAKVTIAEIVPSLLRVLVSAIEVLGADRPSLGTLRHLLIGGEALPSSLCARWEEFYPHVTITNGYGPSECADDVAVHVVNAPAATLGPTVPIGRPIPNVRIYLLNDDLEPVPPGMSGELYVAGRSVGRGYVASPARTAEAFLPDIGGREPGARMYRTGDVARRISSGELVFLGRVDHQVKLRGYRIELGEVEAVLQRHVSVGAAVAGIRQPAEGRSELVAWIVPALGATVGRDELRSFARSWLPEYMVPGTWICLADLPLNANGKVDRAALPYPDPALEAAVPESDERVEPVLAIMRAVLGRPLGVNDDFFRAGGHSLMAVELTHRLGEHFGVRVPLVTVFECPTAAALARWLGAEPARAAAPQPSNTPEPEVSNVAPPTAAQLGTWKIHRSWPRPESLNVWFATRLQGFLDVAALQQALDELVRRHDALRTGFSLVEDAPAIEVEESGRIEVLMRDVTTCAVEDRDRAVHAAIAAEVNRPFDLARPPLVRALLVHSGPDDHTLCVVAHHIIMDGRSAHILTAEAAHLYNAFVAGTPSSLRPHHNRFVTFARRERANLLAGDWDEQASWWVRKLAGIRGHAATAADPPATDARVETALIRRGIDPEVAWAFVNLAREAGCTPFAAWLGALAVALQPMFGPDIRIATPVANRHAPDTWNLVGLLMNTVVMRLNLQAPASFLDLMKQVRDVVREALGRQEYPFDLLSRRIHAEHGIELPAIAPVLFAFDGEDGVPTPLSGLECREIVGDEEEVAASDSLPLSYAVALFSGGDGASWTVEWRRDRLGEQAVARLVDDLAVIVREAVQWPDRPIASPRGALADARGRVHL
jgi:amino acid adenylation domain-containing protein